MCKQLTISVTSRSNGSNDNGDSKRNTSNLGGTGAKTASMEKMSQQSERKAKVMTLGEISSLRERRNGRIESGHQRRGTVRVMYVVKCKERVSRTRPRESNTERWLNRSRAKTRRLNLVCRSYWPLQCSDAGRKQMVSQNETRTAQGVTLSMLTKNVEINQEKRNLLQKRDIDL